MKRMLPTPPSRPRLLGLVAAGVLAVVAAGCGTDPTVLKPVAGDSTSPGATQTVAQAGTPVARSVGGVGVTAGKAGKAGKHKNKGGSGSSNDSGGGSGGSSGGGGGGHHRNHGTSSGPSGGAAPVADPTKTASQDGGQTVDCTTLSAFLGLSQCRKPDSCPIESANSSQPTQSSGADQSNNSGDGSGNNSSDGSSNDSVGSAIGGAESMNTCTPGGPSDPGAGSASSTDTSSSAPGDSSGSKHSKHKSGSSDSGSGG